MDGKVTIKIPRELYNNLGDMIAETGFSSVTEFVIFVMRTLASGGHIGEDITIPDDEVAIIRDRLKRLGYI